MTKDEERDLDGAAGVTAAEYAAEADEGHAPRRAVMAEAEAERRPLADTFNPIPKQIQGFLKPDERNVIAVRRHMVLLLIPAAVFGGGLLAAIIINAELYSAHRAAPAAVHTVWLAWTAAALYAVYRYTIWRDTWFFITVHRVCYLEPRHGFGRRLQIVPISKLRDIEFNQTSPGRFLGYADFEFTSIGTDRAMQHVRTLPWPHYLYQEISDLVMPAEGRAGPKKGRK